MWDVFGVPADRWGELSIEDLSWMVPALQARNQQQAAESKHIGGLNVRG